MLRTHILTSNQSQFTDEVFYPSQNVVIFQCQQKLKVLLLVLTAPVPNLALMVVTMHVKIAGRWEEGEGGGTCQSQTDTQCRRQRLVEYSDYIDSDGNDDEGFCGNR